MIEMKDIRNLYKMFEDDDIDVVEVQNKDMRIKLTVGDYGVLVRNNTKKGSSIDGNAMKSDVAVGNNDLQNTPAANSSEPADDKEIPVNISELKSKWVGFFTRLNPKKGENYVKLRDHVKKDAIIGHVRVLGVLQDLTSEFEGKVTEILVEEGQPIEYGQPIMRFEV